MKVTGWLADDQDPISLTAVFADTGEFGIEKMAAITKETEHTGRLTDSLMWATSSTQHNINNKADEITKPTNRETLYIGSGAPHAAYRETYSGIHVSNEGSSEFIELLKQWAWDVLGINANGAPEDVDRWEALLAHVRDTKTKGNPFVEPNVRSIANYMATRFPESFTIYTKRVVNKQKEIK